MEEVLFCFIILATDSDIFPCNMSQSDVNISERKKYFVYPSYFAPTGKVHEFSGKN